MTLRALSANGALVLVGLIVAAMHIACSDRAPAEAGDGFSAGNPTEPATATATTPATAAAANIDAEMAEAIAGGWERFPAELADGYYLGDPEAPLTITVHEDFQCPHCLNYTASVEPGLIAEYVVQGDVRLLFQHFPILGPESGNAAVATECAQQQDKFWEMHHELFLLQAEAGQYSSERLNVGRYSREALTAIAEQVGLDVTAFEVCIDSMDTVELVQDQASAARSAGLTGTPGVLFNGVPVGGNPGTMENWRLLIDAALEQLETED